MAQRRSLDVNEVFYMETESVAVTVRISQEVLEKRDALVSNRQCTGCEKKLKPKERARCGQCEACYPMTLKKIKARKITKSTLIRDGKLLPKGKAGRKPQSKYSKMLSEL